MKRMPDERCAAICGLFCGACPAYPRECHGCLSDYVRECCRTCKNGFRQCAKEHGVTHCCYCLEFPCERLEDFSKGPIISGVNNHVNAIPDARRMKQIGRTKWLDEQLALHTCPECGELISWYDMGKHSCKQDGADGGRGGF